jgi:hypothetical protein
MTVDKIPHQKDLPCQIDTQYDQMGRKYIAAREADAYSEIIHPSALYIRNHLKESLAVAVEKTLWHIEHSVSQKP